ncbi:MAG: hypothetical protein IKA46_02205 [Clostridia bacterium]|nr:hypothetical protein [Clostridia bacterium]
MRKILEELWYGNICPSDEYYKATKKVKELMSYVADHHDNLHKTLTDKQKELLEKFDSCHAELTDINEREIFVYAFQLGARIAIEIMNFGTDREI